MEAPIYPYFYPLTISCDMRRQRAHENGYQILDETQLTQDSEPLFEGHRQPITYCLGDTALRNWDDYDPIAMRKQTELAVDNNIDGFIFDTYLGVKDGRRIHEMSGALDDTFLVDNISNSLKFGVMAILASPRIALPVSSENGFREGSRDYDISRASIEVIIDHSVEKYWNDDKYIRMKGDRPYISLFVALNRLRSSNDDLSVAESVEYMKEYCSRKYKINPYLVVVSQRSDHAKPLMSRGADAVSSYAMLADFGKENPAVQSYPELLKKRINDWESMRLELDGKPYVPSVVVGWDASARGVNGLDLEAVRGVYPFTPIVQGGNSSLFKEMLESQYDFLKTNVPDDEQYIPINAWNEITEASALLPIVTDSGELDDSYLKTIKEFKENVKKEANRSLKV